jgi:ketosteroid isomerase-like protein
MGESIDDVREIVDRETEAWNKRDVDLLLSVFHPDMVWFWPPDNGSHDPADWESPLGRFDRAGWGKIYSDMFADFDLIRNDREIIRIKVTQDGNGAFAVVDIDTLWEHRATGQRMHWLGRTGKTYTKVDGEWKMIAQTGALMYE